jgi:hypothetical protein
MPVALTSTKGLDCRCHGCGIALYEHEIAGEIYGWYVDYERHIRGDIDGSLFFCDGCWHKINQHVEQEQGDAILKRKELEGGGGDRDYKPKKLKGNAAFELYIEDHPFGPNIPDDVGNGI